MRLLVCGGRDYNDEARVFDCLDSIHAKWPISVLIHGAARGADSLADKWAKERNIPVKAFPADWNKWGKRAGFMRNQKMLNEGKPDGVLAFPGGKGTENMIELATRSKVKVRRIT